jgi:hypothetical protein
MYHDLKTIYWWHGMKRDVDKNVALFVTPVRESRPSSNDPLDCCNLCKYPSVSGKRMLWILSWDCLGFSLDMISFV